jgi:hypothetical protein
LWQLASDGAVDPQHAVANLGLNAWLVNASVGDHWTITYLAEGYENVTLVAASSLGLGAAVVAGFRTYRRRTRRQSAAGSAAPGE